MEKGHRKIGIIGCGRVGSSLAFATYPNADVVAVSSRRPEHRRWLAQRLPDVAVLNDAEEVATLADTVFITTSDAAIKPVCDQINWRRDHHVIHCSGVLTPGVLESAERAGAAVASFHPLQTFPGYGDRDLLDKISFAIDCQDDGLADWLASVAASWHCQLIAVEGEAMHALYHASAVLACGLLAGLIGVSAELWQHAGVERDRALKMMTPMLRSTIEAIAQNGLPGAISGPYVRGDIETVKKHLRSTADVAPDTSRAYAALALAQFHIANEKGNLDPKLVDEIRSLLTEHLETL